MTATQTPSEMARRQYTDTDQYIQDIVDAYDWICADGIQEEVNRMDRRLRQAVIQVALQGKVLHAELREILCDRIGSRY